VEIVNKYKVLIALLPVLKIFCSFIGYYMRSFRLLVTLAFLLSGVTAGVSQPPPPPSGTPSCWPPPCIPVDGGISLLVLAGAAYGAKRIYDSRKNKDLPL
jgi:hypothetical protein